jgi:hypothetical protein
VSDCGAAAVVEIVNVALTGFEPDTTVGSAIAQT